MNHEHNHHHHHHHHKPAGGNETENSLTFQDKLIKRIEHWVDHNEEHVGNYREWAKQSGENEFQDVAQLLEETATAAAGVSRKLEKILKAIKLSNENA